MRRSHPTGVLAGCAPTVGIMSRCPRCFPGSLDLGCDQPGHRASALLMRAGWHAENAAELRADLERQLHRLRDVGPVTKALIERRLPLA